MARRYELSAAAHSADFSKLTGQLSYVHADGGIWVPRYGSLSQEDANGGSVILALDRVMSNYNEGDNVTVKGRIISQRGSTRLGGPLYQVREMNLVNRPSN